MHLRWPRRFDLLSTEAAADRHDRADYAGLASRFYPTAVGADLDLGVDLMSWYFLFDDPFDGPLGMDMHRVERLTAAVAHALEHRPAPSAEPIVRAFGDVWERSCLGMSDAWRTRAAIHWRVYLAGYVVECHYRIGSVHLTAAEHLRLRRDTIGVQPTIDLAERIGHYEVPPRVFFSEHVTAMRLIAAEVDTLHNDICSVEKEEAIGDLNNMVLIVEREQGCDRATSVAVVGRMLKERVERFLALESDIPALCRALGLAPAESHAVDRYVADALRPVMRGDLDWAEQSGRYDSEQPALLPD